MTSRSRYQPAASDARRLLFPRHRSYTARDVQVPCKMPPLRTGLRAYVAPRVRNTGRHRRRGAVGGVGAWCGSLGVELAYPSWRRWPSRPTWRCASPLPVLVGAAAAALGRRGRGGGRGRGARARAGAARGWRAGGRGARAAADGHDRQPAARARRRAGAAAARARARRRRAEPPGAAPGADAPARPRRARGAVPGPGGRSAPRRGRPGVLSRAPLRAATRRPIARATPSPRSS